MLFPNNSIPAINKATVRFSHEVTDPKAGIIVSYIWLGGQVRCPSHKGELECFTITSDISQNLDVLRWRDASGRNL